jgi:3-hydroxyisobutyrate dehydrogenase
VIPEVKQVGFVGLGNMGGPMARNLVKAGFTLTARDTDADRQQRFSADNGCAMADSPEAFATADIVVTMLPDDRVVRAAILEWGIADALPPGAVVVDMSSSNPTGTLRLGAELAAHHVRLIDAPVSGGIPRAETGTLTLMVGGDDEDAFTRAEPVLAALGNQIFRTGPLGSGHAMKALNNYVHASAYVSAAEALVIGLRYGLTPTTMTDVFNASTARSFNTEVVLKEHVVSGRYATGFALGLLAKDVEIAAALAEESDIDAPLCRLVSKRWADAAAELGFAADHSEAHKRWSSAVLVDRAEESSVAPD